MREVEVFVDRQPADDHAVDVETDRGPEQAPDRERPRERYRGGRDRPVYFRPIEVEVKDANVDKAMRALKNRMSKEGVLQEIKRRRFYEKPSVRRKRKEREALKRLRRAARRQFK